MTLAHVLLAWAGSAFAALCPRTRCRRRRAGADSGQCAEGIKLVLADDAPIMCARTRCGCPGAGRSLAADVTYANFSSGPLRPEQHPRRGGADRVRWGCSRILAHSQGAGVVIIGAVITGPRSITALTAPGSKIEDAPRTSRASGSASMSAPPSRRPCTRNLRAFRPHHRRCAAGQSPGSPSWTWCRRALPARSTPRCRSSRTAPAASSPPWTGRRAGDRQRPGTPTSSSGIPACLAPTALQDPAQAAAIRDFVVHRYRAHLGRTANQAVWISDYLVKDQRLNAADAGLVWRARAMPPPSPACVSSSRCSRTRSTSTGGRTVQGQDAQGRGRVRPALPGSTRPLARGERLEHGPQKPDWLHPRARRHS